MPAPSCSFPRRGSTACPSLETFCPYGQCQWATIDKKIDCCKTGSFPPRALP